MTVDVPMSIYAQLEDERAASASAVNPCPTMASVVLAKLDRPLHVDARARRSVARVPNGPAGELLRRATEAPSLRLSIAATECAVNIVDDTGAVWASFPVTDQRGLEAAHAEARLALDTRLNLRALVQAFVQGGTP